MTGKGERVPASLTDTELRAVLADIGATPAKVDALLAGLDEVALHTASPDGHSCHAIVREFVRVSGQLGAVAHDVLGHVPGAGAVKSVVPPTTAMLQEQLRFLREHIVSTVDQQGAAVWSTPTPAGRPLSAHAVDVQERDRTLLADLAHAAATIRSQEHRED
jgi:hypothetical protein